MKEHINNFLRPVEADLIDITDLLDNGGPAPGTHLLRPTHNGLGFHHGITAKEDGKNYVVEFNGTEEGAALTQEQLESQGLYQQFFKLQTAILCDGYGDFGPSGDKLVNEPLFSSYKKPGKIMLVPLKKFIQNPSGGTLPLWVVNGLEQTDEKLEASKRAMAYLEKPKIYSYHLLFRNCENFVNTCFGNKYVSVVVEKLHSVSVSETYDERLYGSLMQLYSGSASLKFQVR